MTKNKYINNFFIILVLLIVPTQILGPAIPDIIISFYATFFLIYFIMFEKNKYKIIIFEKWFIIGIIFCIGSIISSSINDNYLNSLSSSIPYFRFILFAFFFKLYFLSNEKYLSLLIIVIAGSIFFTSIDIIIQYFFGKDIFGYESALERNSGPFGEELKGGSFISKYFTLCLIFLIVFSNNKLLKFNKIFIFVAVCLIGVLLSGERAALIHIVLSILMLIIFFIKKIYVYKKTIFSTLICFILFFIFLVSADHKNRFYYTIDELSSFRNIIDSHYGAHYITAFQIFKENILFGIGQNNFRIVCNDKKYSELKSKRIDDRCSTHPHNYYIQIISDLGIINLLLFLTLIYYLFFNTIKNNNNYILNYGKIISLVIIFFPFLPTGSFYNNWNSSLNWIIISICISSSVPYQLSLFNFLKKYKENK